MRRHLALLPLAVACALPAGAGGAAPRQVDMLTGSAPAPRVVPGHSPAAGNTVPGPSLPFGFAHPSPDTDCRAASGYCAGSPVLGFSQTHVSGTGGDGTYGNLRLTPLAGKAHQRPLASRAVRERARVGRYSTFLSRQRVHADLTAGRLATLSSFRFPRTRPRGLLRLDVTSAVAESSRHGQRPRGSAVRLHGRGARGWVRMKGGWSGGAYKLHFALRFDRRPEEVALWRGGSRRRGSRLRSGPGGRTALIAAFRTRRTRTVRVQVGLSFRSSAKAARNLRRLGGFALRRVERRNRRAWTRALGAIRVSGGSAAERRTFATALYHAQLMPHDLAGENAWWRSDQPHYEDFYTLWDAFRTQMPLLTLIRPRRQSGMIRSLLDTYRHTGWLPDARIAGRNGWTQVGSSATVVLADALVKGLPGIDRELAFRAVRRDAERPSPAPLRHGRELADYRRLGYLPTSTRASASRTVEYAYNDFAASQVAARSGHPAAARRWRERSRSWANLWDPSSRAIRPRDREGHFAAGFDPARRQYGDAPFYEGSAFGYSTFVPHDLRGLIARVGGEASFVDWLDMVMESHYDPANEPTLLAPWLYVHACRQDRTAAWTRRLATAAYGPGRAGLPGNDDAGTLSSWYVWAALGLYPNAGQPFYYIGSPAFRRARIRLGRGRSFTVASSGSGPYVAGASLNGRPLRRAFLAHGEVARGGILGLRLSPRPAGLPCARRPPSL